MTELEQEGLAFEEVRQLLAQNDSEDQVTEQRCRILRPHVQDLVHLECPASINNVHNTERAQAHFINGLVDLALWLHKQAEPDLSTDKLPRRVLLHCADGYTETSLLAVTYVMIARRCTAPDAYVYLQNDRHRSFFVYAADKPTVVRLEQRVHDVLAREDAEMLAVKTARFDIDADDRTMLADIAAAAEMEAELSSIGMERSDSGYVSNASSTEASSSSTGKTTSSLFSGSWYRRGKKNAGEQKTVAEEPALPSAPAMELSSSETHTWFYDDNYDGHFPSRILPFLVSAKY